MINSKLKSLKKRNSRVIQIKNMIKEVDLLWLKTNQLEGVNKN